eukprot:gnl/Dysnectes_brevis/2746_a3340_1300.p1 GENE.gnl/Dysnectes_brevis/2746_a3340_1300~~gnl/Dysnectes_brevis/2746_a3340_1300.p1  ORF type:complete len:285 (+),score=67.25 gnl/Dysnectes_brevis/2746_a3340_1300:18-872(+)
MIYDITTLYNSERQRHLSRLGEEDVSEDARNLLDRKSVVEIDVIEPKWLTTARKIKDNITAISRLCDQIEIKRAEREKNVIDDTIAHDIDALTTKITSSIRKTQSQLQHFQRMPPADAEAKILQKSLHRSLHTSLQEITTRFRARQTKHLQQLRARDQRLAGHAPSLGLGHDEDLTGLTGGVRSVLQAQRERIEDREQEIYGIARSITDIADMTQEMAGMMEHHGTLLDRIDSNMTEAVEHAEDGLENLHGARKKQLKGQRLQKITYFLMLIDFALLVIYVLRK